MSAAASHGVTRRRKGIQDQEADLKVYCIILFYREGSKLIVLFYMIYVLVFISGGNPNSIQQLNKLKKNLAISADFFVILRGNALWLRRHFFLS